MKNTMNNVRLVLYHRDHEAGLEAFALPEEQHEFTALPFEVIQNALEGKTGVSTRYLMAYDKRGLGV